MDTSLVVDKVVELVSTTYAVHAIKVGDGQAPDLSELTAASLATPHVIVYQVPIGEAFEGEGYGGGQGMEWIRLQFTVVALTAMQVRRLATDIQNTVAARDPLDSSTWINPITVVDHAVINRKKSGIIPMEPTGSGFHGGSLVSLLVQSTG